MTARSREHEERVGNGIDGKLDDWHDCNLLSLVKHDIVMCAQSHLQRASYTTWSRLTSKPIIHHHCSVPYLGCRFGAIVMCLDGSVERGKIRVS